MAACSLSAEYTNLVKMILPIPNFLRQTMTIPGSQHNIFPFRNWLHGQSVVCCAFSYGNGLTIPHETHDCENKSLIHNVILLPRRNSLGFFFNPICGVATAREAAVVATAGDHGRPSGGLPEHCLVQDIASK